MRRVFFIAAAVCLSAFGAFAQARINVRLAAETKVENNILTLGDVAQISGGGEKAQRLRAISLGYSPNIGMTRELSKEKIALAISAAGFAPGEFLIEAPPIVRVRRAEQEIGHNQIREAVEAAVLNQFIDNKIEARIVRLDLPEKIALPLGKFEIRTNMTNVRNYFAPFALSIDIRVNDAVIRRLSANIEIEAFAEILVAVGDLAAETKIDENNVRLERRRIDKPLASYLRETEKLRGSKLIKNLAGGAELTTDSFVASFVVRSGDLVRIVGQSGKLQITVNGEARSNGKIGDRIAVKNSQSNLIVQATVVDEGLVKVLF